MALAAFYKLQQRFWASRVELCHSCVVQDGAGFLVPAAVVCHVLPDGPGSVPDLAAAPPSAWRRRAQACPFSSIWITGEHCAKTLSLSLHQM